MSPKKTEPMLKARIILLALAHLVLGGAVICLAINPVFVAIGIALCGVGLMFAWGGVRFCLGALRSS